MRWFWSSVVLLNLLVAGMAFFSSWTSWRAYAESAEISTQNLALVLEREIAGMFVNADFHLRSMIDIHGKKNIIIDSVQEEIWQSNLRRISSVLPIISSFAAIDIQGEVISGKVLDDSRSIDFSDYDFFIAHRNDPNVGLFISQPIRSQDTEQWSLVVSRRLNGADGDFNGIVTATISLQVLYESFSDIKLGRNGSIGIRDSGLRLIVRYPFLAGGGQIGSTRIADDFTSALARDATRGSYRAGATSIDGIRRFYSYRLNPIYSFYVNVGLSEEEQLATWSRQTAWTCGLVAIFLFVTVSMALWLGRSWRVSRSALADAKRLTDALDNVPSYIYIKNRKHQYIYANSHTLELFRCSPEELVGSDDTRFFPPQTVADLWEVDARVLNLGERTRKEIEVAPGTPDWRVYWELKQPIRDAQGAIQGLCGVSTDITERKRAENELKKLEWLLRPKTFAPDAFVPLYGDVTRLNTCRTILDAVGVESLHSIISEFMGMLETSSAVYETNGDYAAGIFSSGWCQLMDGASFRLCGTEDTAQALACGRWLCHESCWKESSLPAIRSGQPNEIACAGGIHLYAVPVRAGEEIIGSINFGFGNPPCDEQKLLELSRNYQVDLVEMKRVAVLYQERPPFVIELAKRRLVEAANLIGLLVTRKRDALRLQQTNQELEQRVRERTSELSVANQELEAFSYSVSHDLRAPLRAISGFSQALLEDNGEQFQGEARFYLNLLDQSSREMGQLIDSLLRLSRVSRVEMILEKVDLSVLAEKVIEKLAHGDPGREVTVRIMPGLVVHGDAQLLRSALENLLGNAWKYTGKTDRAEIHLEMEKRDGAMVYMVRDNGAGFDMAHVNRLFTPFQRLHRNDEFPGEGVGLVTVQRIIHRHGGKIWAEAALGRGATFFFTLNAADLLRSRCQPGENDDE
ncbi:MAG: PAS domain-containing protein [Magnetococcales bacterium]|nr:PAS domain-containing protein [Magnetococcales bacterium]